MFLNIKEEEIISIRVIPQLKTVFDTLLSDIVKANKIVNKLVEQNHPEKTYMLLFLSPPSSFQKFFLELAKTYLMGTEEISLIKEQEIMIIAYSHLLFVISDYNLGEQILKQRLKQIPALAQYQPFELKSLVLDTTHQDEKKIIKRLKKTFVEPSIRAIITFNNRLHPEPPLKLREFLIEKLELENLELLNYNDTNGLKTILLQSYYNVAPEPFEAREVFELTD